MKKVKGLMIVTVGIIAILFAFCVWFYKSGHLAGWQSITAINGYHALLDRPIGEIVLRKTIDYAEWVEITDSDLIEVWTDFFQNLEVKKDGVVVTEEMDGGFPVIEIRTDTAAYFIYLHENKLVLNENSYLFRTPESIPFSQTYDTAVERHGVKSPWD